MIIEIELVKQDETIEEKTKNFVLQLRSLEDEGMTFEIHKGYRGVLDDVYTDRNDIPYEDLEPGKYVFREGTLFAL